MKETLKFLRRIICTPYGVVITIYLSIGLIRIYLTNQLEVGRYMNEVKEFASETKIKHKNKILIMCIFFWIAVFTNFILR